MTEEYLIELANVFEADDPRDAAIQFCEWATEHVRSAMVRVKGDDYDELLDCEDLYYEISEGKADWYFQS